VLGRGLADVIVNAALRRMARQISVCVEYEPSRP
jgi:hypothetical protein